MANRSEHFSQGSNGLYTPDVQIDSAQAVRRARTRNVVNLAMSDPEQFKSAKNWYNEAHDIAQGQYKQAGADSPTHAAGILSSVSAGSDWEGSNAGVLGQIGKVPEHVARDIIADPMGGRSKHFDTLKALGIHTSSGDNLAKALRIRGGEDPYDVLQSHKYASFNANIDNPGNEDQKRTWLPAKPVTVDYRANDISDNEMRPTGDKVRGKISGRYTDQTVKGEPKSTTRNYEEHADAYRDAAEVLTDRLGIEVKPHEAQAGTWTLGKQREREAGAAQKNNTVKKVGRVGQHYA